MDSGKFVVASIWWPIWQEEAVCAVLVWNVGDHGGHLVVAELETLVLCPYRHILRKWGDKWRKRVGWVLSDGWDGSVGISESHGYSLEYEWRNGLYLPHDLLQIYLQKLDSDPDFCHFSAVFDHPSDSSLGPRIAKMALQHQIVRPLLRCSEVYGQNQQQKSHFSPPTPSQRCRKLDFPTNKYTRKWQKQRDLHGLKINRTNSWQGQIREDRVRGAHHHPQERQDHCPQLDMYGHHLVVSQFRLLPDQLPAQVHPGRLLAEWHRQQF